jgi:hypothetical protein
VLKSQSGNRRKKVLIFHISNFESLEFKTSVSTEMFEKKQLQENPFLKLLIQILLEYEVTKYR